MQCSSCGFQNPDGMKFCGQCGSKLDTSDSNLTIPQEDLDGKGSIAEATSQPALVPTSSNLTSADFVGRQREMAELVSAFEDVMAGYGRLVMLVGEPGIGKTRTARELSTIAEQHGAQLYLKQVRAKKDILKA